MPVFASFSSALALLCVKIFFCRILDVSLSTVRTILSVRGKTLQATAIGFFETLVWFLIVREALASDAGGLALAVSYAGGFAAGTFVGGQLANLLIKGDLTLQVITSPAHRHSRGRLCHLGARRERLGIRKRKIPAHRRDEKQPSKGLPQAPAEP